MKQKCVKHFLLGTLLGKMKKVFKVNIPSRPLVIRRPAAQGNTAATPQASTSASGASTPAPATPSTPTSAGGASTPATPSASMPAATGEQTNPTASGATGGKAKRPRGPHQDRKCCVEGCVPAPTASFHRIPTLDNQGRPDQRLPLWLDILGIDAEENKRVELRVCSNHFNVSIFNLQRERPEILRLFVSKFC